MERLLLSLLVTSAAVGVIVLALAALSSTPLGAKLYHRLPQRAAQVTGAAAIIAGLLVCTAYLVDGTYNPFLYFQF